MKACRQIEMCCDELSAGSLPPALACELQAHLTECAACRLVMKESQQLRKELATLADCAPPDALWQQISTRLQDASSWETRRQRWLGDRTSRSWGRFGLGLAGTALACGLAVVILRSNALSPAPSSAPARIAKISAQATGMQQQAWSASELARESALAEVGFALAKGDVPYQTMMLAHHCTVETSADHALTLTQDDVPLPSARQHAGCRQALHQVVMASTLSKIDVVDASKNLATGQE